MFADFELSGAFSFSSPLSIPYLLDALVPKLAAAVDGDPATAVPDQDIGAGVEAGGSEGGELDDDEAAAALAYETVFDRGGDTSTVTRDEFCSFMASARTPCP